MSRLGCVSACVFSAVLASNAWAQSPSDDENASLSELTVAGALLGKRIDQIKFAGNQKVENDAILSKLSSKIDAPLSLIDVREDIRAIWELGSFEDVAVAATLTPAEDAVVLLYTVREKPLIRKIFVSGNQGLDLDKLNEVIDLKRDSVLDAAKIKANRDKLSELYTQEGYYLANIRFEVRPVNESEADVWYLISEGSKVEIREVAFVGNHNIPDDELRSFIRTRKASGFALSSGGGTFNEAEFEDDLNMITAYYWDHGYVTVQLSPPQIRLSADKKYMYVSIKVDEGPVYTIKDITLKGDLLGTDAEHRAQMGVRAGQVFNRSQLQKDVLAITNRYKDRGYAFANIALLRDVDPVKRLVSLSFEIERGKKVYFERINIRGNSRTRDKVVRREMKISEGELYNETYLETSRRRILALGFFEDVKITTERGSSDEFVDVEVVVSERPTGSFQVGAGFSSVENFIAQAQISQNNLFGRGQTLAFQAQLSSLRQLFLLRFVEPYFLDSNWTFAFDAFNQSRGFESFSRNSVGGNLTFGYPLSWEARAFLTYKLEDVSVSSGTRGFTDIGAVRVPVEAASVANLFRGGLTSSVRASIQYDSRDDRLFPTSGWFHTAFVEVADRFTGSENVFVRYGGFSRHYRPLFGPFVLRMNAEMGITTSRDPLGVPITERYLIGGIFDVRGFRPRSLGPVLRVMRPGDPGQALGQLPLGGNLQVIWNSEIEFWLFRKVGIKGVVFFDAGNAYNLEERYCGGSAGSSDAISPKFDPCFRFPDSLLNGIRSSVGFGFRWISPIGPLRFEWGIPLDRQPNEEPLVFEFTVGNFL